MCSTGEMLGSLDKKVGLAGRKLKIICVIAPLRRRRDPEAKQATLLIQVLYIYLRVCVRAYFIRYVVTD